MLRRLRNKLCGKGEPQSIFKRGGFLEAANVTPKDVFLVSFPRSGNTWMRAIIAYMLYSSEQIRSLSVLDQLVPNSGRDVPLPDDPPQLRVIKTHRAYGVRHELHNPDLYHKNIYVVRHPFDAIRSFYDYTQSLNWWPSRKFSMEDFVYELTYGALIPASWHQHVLSWYVMRRQHEILFIRYEDMQADMDSIIEQVAGFLGVPVAPAKLQEIKQHASLEAMKRLEERGSLIKKDYPHVRTQAEKREVRAELTPELKEFIWKQSQEAMSIFDYKPK